MQSSLLRPDPRDEEAMGHWEAGASILLVDPERAWLLESGCVDLFAVAIDNGNLLGHRAHILRLTQGAAIFGLPLSSHGLLAVPAGDARLQPFQCSLLAADSRLVGSWISHLTRAIDAGDETNQEETKQDNLASFQARICDALARRAALKEQDDRERLIAQGKHDVLLASSSALKLAAPLNGKGKHYAAFDAGEDVLLTACRAIGRVLDIEFKGAGTAMRKEPLRQMEKIARVSRVRFRSVLLRGQWWRGDQGPLLAFRASAPLALIPNGPSAYTIFDPQNGAFAPARGAALDGIEPVAFIFYRKFHAKEVTTLDVLKFGAHGCGRDIAITWLLGLSVGVLGLLTPILTGLLFDSVIPSADQVQLLQIAAVLLIAAISSYLFTLTRNYAALRAESRASNALQAAVWDRLLNLPARFFRNYSSGDLAARAMGIDSIRQVLAGSTITTIFSSLFSIVSLGLLFYYSPSFAALAVVLTGISIAAATGVGLLQFRLQRSLTELGGKLSSLVLQILQGMPKIRVANAETRAYSAWVDELSKQNVLTIRSARLNMYFGVFNSIFSVATTMMLFTAMANVAAVKGMGAGKFIAFLTAFGQFYGGVSGLSGALLGALSIVPTYRRAKPLLHTPLEVPEFKSDPGELTGEIEISHVNFTYSEDAALVLNDVSITIKPGQFVAVVGHSGCGKSTLMRLLLGFETPQKGGIYYDGCDLATLDTQAVRRQMGVVIQNSIVLPGDIRANILGSAPLTVDDAWEAARLAGLEDDIKAMPMGMHTLIGEGGSGLSGGQRQRLLIARALVHKPRILLLDEATSALDNRTQAVVTRNLEQLKTTRFVIAHRLSTIQNADLVVVLDKGSVVQAGSYEELVSKPGPFAELAKRQLEMREG